MKIKNTEIKVIQADITELAVDAIVNAANNKMLMGGGVAGAIKRKGGQVIEDEALKKAPIEVGDAIFTSAGKLKAKYVIHAATMSMDFKTDEKRIRNASRNALIVAQDLKIKSLAFPALGCGTGGFSYLASAKIMAQETLKFLRSESTPLKEIVFCLFDKEAYEIFNKGVISYLEYVTTKLQAGPYCTVDAIIELKDNKIILIKRSNPPFGWALPGGFVDNGESLEAAVTREAKEETGLEINQISQFHTYSDPLRDPRFHTIGTVFLSKAEGIPKAGDDASDALVISPEEAIKLDLAFDHKKIIEDYINFKKSK